ncbi:DUF2059 domain-containing protein [Luteimonas sp. A478]
MKLYLRTFSLAVLLVLVPPAFAQQPTQEQVGRLLEVMRAQQTLEAILPQVQASQQQMVAQATAGQQLDAAERERIDRIVARGNTAMAQALSWEKLEPVYRDIYMATFTGEDMDAMITFYESQAGQHLLDKMPQLMQNTMQAVQQMLMPILAELEQDLAAEFNGE